MKYIDINLTDDKCVSLIDGALRQMENDATTLRITLTDEFLNLNYVVVFQLNNNTPIVSAPLIPNESNQVEVIIQNSLTYQNGFLKCELQGYDGDVLMKSAIFALQVVGAIQGEPAPMPTVYPPLYDYYDYDATDFGIVDLGNFFVATTVEDAFQEVGSKIRGIYDDLPPVPLLTARVGSTPPTLTTFKGTIPQYTFNQNTNEVFGNTEITHQYKEGTDIMAHIHWATNGVDTTDRFVKWELEYTVSTNGVFGDPVILSTEVLVPANSPTTSYSINSLGNIAGVNLKIGEYIIWKLRRVTATGTAPSNNPFGIAVGFHVQMDSFGSATVYSK